MKHSTRLYLRRRSQLVDLLRSRGIEDEEVLAAFGSVARERFVDVALRNRAYQDEALPIGLRQTISQPYTVAYQTVLLSLESGAKVLEVGTGSGYQAAILCEMGARVFSVERHHALYQRARRLLDQLGYRVVTRHGDGTHGWESCAPFDGIVVTAAAREVPKSLLHQLRIPADGSRGGRLVIPVGDTNGQLMTLIERTSEDTFTRQKKHSFRFVPLVPG